MYSVSNGVNGNHFIKEREVPYFIQRYDQSNFPKDWEEHEENCKRGIASSSSLTQEQWEVLNRGRLDKEKRQKQAEWEIYNSLGGEVCQPVCTDIFRFHRCFSKEVTVVMKAILIEFSRMHYAGERVGLEQTLLGQVIGGVSRWTIIKALKSLTTHKEVCPICKQEGFSLLELDEKYDYHLDNKCDSYKVLVIDYLKHLNLHFREMNISDFNQKVEEFRNFSPEW